jgi:cytochrome c oxidase cbb3-type subunit I
MTASPATDKDGILSFTRTSGSAALAFIVMGAVWFAVGTSYGAISAIDLIAPDFFSNIAPFVFGRVRPTHVNTVLYGFVASTLVGCGLYYVPALLRTKLWSEPLGWVSLVLWNLTVLSGPLLFPFGLSQGREYAEYIWIFDVTIVLSMLLIIVNIVMTITSRVEDQLYVSVWYFMGTFLWTSGAYTVGNVMWHPSTGAVSGIMDSIFLWFWGHSLPGLLLTPLAVGAAYFVVPRVTRTPLYSHTLSIIGFWTLVALYTHIGGHHILQTPIPNWLKVFSVVDSAAMVIPVFVVIVNLWVTARGHGSKIWDDPAGRFVMGGVAWYLLVCIQGPVQSFPAIQRITHLTNWTVGHSHIAILGFAGYIALGAAWHIVPLILKRKVWSNRLINLQFGLVTFGLAGFFFVLTIAGLIQGQSWYNGEVVYRVIPEIAPYMVARLALGIFIITASFIGLYNLIMTIRHGEPLTPDEALGEGQP